ncbi:MAG: DUF115 domain-containing protein [Acidobacteria bacterium]|nr:DUF115 domain-containing protein [Acidobacteriota bacterium]
MSVGSVRVDGDSTVDPVSHAWTWLQQQLDGRPMPALLGLIGAGQGYLLDALERHAPDTRVLAIEPSLDDARAFLARRDWSGWRASGRLVYLIDPDYTGSGDAWRIVPVGQPDHAVRILAGSNLQLGEGVARATKVLKQVLFDARANADARRRLAPRYLTNVLRNIPAIASGQNLKVLEGAYSGVPAVIAAAGPSLDAAIPELLELRDRAVVFACDTALRPLLLGGITPQYVVGIDPSPLNARHFLSLPDCPGTRLICDLALDRQATASFEERTFWFRVADHHPGPWLASLGLDVEKVDVWGSVLTAAFQAACLAGCEPIVFVGADLSFTGGRSYARATTYELDWGAATGSGAELERVWRGQMGEQVSEVEDVRGVKTQVTPAMLSFRDWLVARARHSGRRVINATKAGMLFGAGIEQASLASALEAQPSVPEVEHRIPPQRHVRPTKLASHVRNVRKQLADSSAAATPVAQWIDFAGDGFDREAVRAALDEAAHTLETKQGRPAETVVTSWRRLASSSAAPAFLTQVPEALTRLRLAMGGVESPAIVPDDNAWGLTDRAAVLVEALELLEEIRGAAQRADSLDADPNPTLIGRLPVSVIYPWPDAYRWAIVAFEALIGRVWGDVVHPPSKTWFGGTDRLIDSSAFAGNGVVTDRRATRSTAGTACLQLLLEWVRCAAGVLRPAEKGLFGALDRLVALEALVRAQHRGDARDTHVLTIEMSAGDRSAQVALRLQVNAGMLARVLTGCVRESFDASYQLIALQEQDLQLAILVETDKTVRPVTPENPIRSRGTCVAPRVVTAGASPHAVVAYYAQGEAIVVAPHDRASRVIRADGRSHVHLEWPRPIMAEMPFGDEGFIAWGLGFGGGYPMGPGYVMYRTHRRGQVQIEHLPVRPSVGVCWQGRVYWSCYPRAVDTWVGIVSWAPGEPVRFEHPGITVFDMQPDENGLLLQPCAFDVRGHFARRRLDHGWIWQPGHALSPRPLDARGPVSWRDTNGPWVATAFPEADIVQLEAPDGTTRQLTCHYPSRAAWTGDSLLVSTVSRELLLFEGISDALEATR